MKTQVGLLLRQFEALVTALRRNVFQDTKLRLTGFYVVVLLVTLFIAGALTNYNQSWFLSQNLQTEIGEHVSDQKVETAVQTTAKEAKSTNYLIYFFLAAIVSGVSYFLADRSLRPLGKIMESQRRFLANASHELKTPLSVMKTDCEVILREGDYANKDTLKDVLENNIKEIDRMTGIINNLLFISHRAHEANRIPFMPINFTEVIERIRSRLETLAAKKGVTLSIATIPSAEVRGNMIALEEVAMNLAKNAIAYTPRGGRVALILQKTRRGVEFVVSDTGIGIDAKDMTYIFEPFFKSKKEKAYANDGSGLGLAIVREIVDLHEGSIRMASAPNQGTSVSLVLPFA